jgi:NADPH-dependent glutamate synthase beta subunit-like oxidoreductase
MDTQTLLGIANSCLTGQKPPCACACPLGVDVQGIAEKLQSGSFSAAYKSYAKSVLFPDIVSRICPEPCRDRCVRASVDASVSLRALEKACVDHTREKLSSSFYIPPKNKRVLIVGGGPTGLTCAVRLAHRGYPVHLFEQRAYLGGRLFDIDPAVLPREVLLDEITCVTQTEYLTVSLNTRLQSLDGNTFDVALVATGNNGDTFGALKKDGTIILRDGVMFAGSLIEGEHDPIWSIAQGMAWSYAVEAFLKVGSMNPPETHTAACAFKPYSSISPSSFRSYRWTLCMD